MQVPAIAIGLPEEWVSEIARRSNVRIVSYPWVPNGYSLDGKIHIQSPTIESRWLEPKIVLWYGYFYDDGKAAELRKALAISSVKSYPDIVATYLLDDKFTALLLARRKDRMHDARGYLSNNLPEEHKAQNKSVIKWGNSHCGEDKSLIFKGEIIRPGSIVEPFYEGTSVRILSLFTGKYFQRDSYQLRYESEDWRKNISSTITREPLNSELAKRAYAIAQSLELDIAGIDFILTPEGTAHLLEVNAYPSLDEVPEALEIYINNAVSAVIKAQD